MKSTTIALYSKKTADLTPGQIEFVDNIYAWAEKNYQKGGDTIVECMDPNEVLSEFKTLGEAIRMCKIRKDHSDEIEATAW